VSPSGCTSGGSKMVEAASGSSSMDCSDKIAVSLDSGLYSQLAKRVS